MSDGHFTVPSDLMLGMLGVIEAARGLRELHPSMRLTDAHVIINRVIDAVNALDGESA